MNGLDLDAMIVGLMSFRPSTKAASAVLFSAILSSVGGPVASVYLISAFPGLKLASEELPLLAAVVIGGSVTWALPVLISFTQNKWGGKNA